MVPPGGIGPVPDWVIVYLAALVAGAIAGVVIYHRVIRLVLQGRSTARFDRPFQRLKGAAAIVLGQRKVLQRVPQRDWAGIGHALIFWGFLSFTLSYVIFIFGASIWRHFPEWLLTSAGVRVYTVYLDLLAALLLVMLAWAVLRRWVARPHRLSFDRTRSLDSVIIVAMTAGLMASTLLAHAFYAASGATGPEAETFIGGALGNLFAGMGLTQGGAGVSASRVLVDAPGHHPGIRRLHTLFQAHAHGGGAGQRLLPFPGQPGRAGTHRPGDGGAFRRRARPGPDLETTSGRLRLRRLRTLHRFLPRQPHRQGSVSHAHRGKSERPHD